jgi:hypothetical protein
MSANYLVLRAAGPIKSYGRPWLATGCDLSERAFGSPNWTRVATGWDDTTTNSENRAKVAAEGPDRSRFNPNLTDAHEGSDGALPNYSGPVRAPTSAITQP